MNKYKIAIGIGVAFLIMIFLFLVVYVGNIFALDNEEKTLEEGHLINYVEVDEDVKMNYRRFGNPTSGKHIIITISDYDDDVFSVTSEMLTYGLLNGLEVIAIDRPGYGFSEDTVKEQTIDTIIDEYRSALSKAGFNPPYILMADGFGSVYATYWLMTHEDEVEGVIYINPYIIPTPEEIEDKKDSFGPDSSHSNFASVNWFGFNRIFMNFKDIKPWVGLDEVYAKYAKALAYKNMYSLSKYSEKKCEYDNLLKVSKLMKPTEVPKLLMSSILEDSHEAEDYFLYLNNLYKKSGTKEKYRTDFENIDYYFGQYQKKYKEYKEEVIMPFIDRLGSVRYTNIPGYEKIYLQKPEDVRTVMKYYLNRYVEN